MNESAKKRYLHAACDRASRDRRALKIKRLLGLDASCGYVRLLEIGCGSGRISRYFGSHPTAVSQVEAVDTYDSRVVHEGYRFTLVPDTSLPFADEAFDVVVSNHVIEHVGYGQAQAHHLSELRRVLRPERYWLSCGPEQMDPDRATYRLAFLSWWPESWRSAWLRLWKKGGWYDCRPMSRGDLERGLSIAGFRFQQQNRAAVEALLEIERPDTLLWEAGLKHVPSRIWDILGGINPTLIYLLRRA